MNKKTDKKIRISDAAAVKYLENDRFTIASLADELDMEASEIYDFFPNRRSILQFYYEAAIIKYRRIITQIDDYSSFSMAEKLSTLALTLLDLFQENREFVKRTYPSYVVCKSGSTSFEKSLKQEIASIYKGDQKQSRAASLLNIEPIFELILYHFHGLIRFWLRDHSEGYQKTMELVDKWTAFVQEVNYSSILDRGFELAKFAAYQTPLKNVFSSSHNNTTTNE